MKLCGRGRGREGGFDQCRAAENLRGKVKVQIKGKRKKQCSPLIRTDFCVLSSSGRRSWGEEET
jgi:hypothetical protein